MTDVSIGTAEEARELAGAFLALVAREHPTEHPAKATAAVAMMLGAMVASLVATGVAKPKTGRGLLEHLFQMAEQAAGSELEAA